MTITRRNVLSCAAGAGAASWISSRLPAFAAGPADTAWLKDIYCELHLDAHFGQVPAPYEGFNADRSAQILKDAGFQMVSFFASCGAGFSYYPTKIGLHHPGLKRDFTGGLAAALKQRGIRTL